MWRKIALALLVIGVFAVPEAWAQKFELAPFAGYRTGGSFTAEAEEPMKITVDGVPTYGFVAGVGLDESWQIEFIWSRTETQMEERPPDFASPATKLFDTNIDVYHVNLLWQYGLAQDRFRPFAFGGLGATHFQPEGDFSSETRFSLGFGGGIKLFFSDNFGIRFQGRLIPTLMQADSEIYCRPHRPCYRIYDDTYLFQGEFTFALVLRIL
jgi:opacity protein-like surface antigen